MNPNAHLTMQQQVALLQQQIQNQTQGHTRQSLTNEQFQLQQLAMRMNPPNFNTNNPPSPMFPLTQPKQPINQPNQPPVKAPVKTHTSQERLDLIDTRLAQNIDEESKTKLHNLRKTIVEKMALENPSANQPDKKVRQPAAATVSISPPPIATPQATPHTAQQPSTFSSSQQPQDQNLVPTQSLTQLLSELSPSSLFEQDVQLLLTDCIADFVKNACDKSLSLARHRGEGRLSVHDVKIGVEMGYGIGIAGYGESKFEQVRKPGRAYRTMASTVDAAKHVDKKKKK